MIVDDSEGLEFGQAVWRFIDRADVSKPWVGKPLDMRVFGDVVRAIGGDGLVG